MEKTAVEWLVNELVDRQNGNGDSRSRDEIFEQAKEMKKSNEKRLQTAIEDILWMAARYAHGRHTYAPCMVRRSVEVFKDVFPEFKIKQDYVIEPPEDMYFQGDYLHDIFNNEKK